MQHRLYGLRGKAYATEYKRIFHEEGVEVAAVFDRLRSANHGKFSAMMLGELAMEVRLPLAWLDDCLPELTGGQYPCGTWERLKDSGVKASDIGVIWRDD
jgi:hypothetical protein